MNRNNSFAYYGDPYSYNSYPGDYYRRTSAKARIDYQFMCERALKAQQNQCRYSRPRGKGNYRRSRALECNQSVRDELIQLIDKCTKQRSHQTNTSKDSAIESGSLSLKNPELQSPSISKTAIASKRGTRKFSLIREKSKTSRNNESSNDSGNQSSESSNQSKLKPVVSSLEKTVKSRLDRALISRYINDSCSHKEKAKLSLLVQGFKKQKVMAHNEYSPAGLSESVSDDHQPVSSSQETELSLVSSSSGICSSNPESLEIDISVSAVSCSDGGGGNTNCQPNASHSERVCASQSKPGDKNERGNVCRSETNGLTVQNGRKSSSLNSKKYGRNTSINRSQSKTCEGTDISVLETGGKSQSKQLCSMKNPEEENNREVTLEEGLAGKRHSKQAEAGSTGSELQDFLLNKGIDVASMSLPKNELLELVSGARVKREVEMEELTKEVQDTGFAETMVVSTSKSSWNCEDTVSYSPPAGSSLLAITEAVSSSATTFDSEERPLDGRNTSGNIQPAYRNLMEKLLRITEEEEKLSSQKSCIEEEILKLTVELERLKNKKSQINIEEQKLRTERKQILQEMNSTDKSTESSNFAQNEHLHSSNSEVPSDAGRQTSLSHDKLISQPAEEPTSSTSTKQGKTVLAHKASVSCIKVFENWLFVGCSDGTIKKFSAEDLVHSASYAAHKKSVTALHAENMKIPVLFSASLDSSLYIHSIEESVLLNTINFCYPISCMAGQWNNVFVTQENTVIKCDIKSEFTLYEEYKYEAETPVLGLSPSSQGAQRLLCILGQDGKCLLFDTINDILIGCLANKISSPACIAYDGNTKAIATKDGIIYLHEFYTNRLVKMSCYAAPLDIKIIDNHVVVCCVDSTVRCFKKESSQWDQPEKWNLHSMYTAEGADDKTVLTCMDVYQQVILVGTNKGRIEAIPFHKLFQGKNGILEIRLD